MSHYPELGFFIDGAWSRGSGKGQTILNPATEDELGVLPHAGQSELDAALAAAERAFPAWRDTSAYARSAILRKAAQYLRDNVADIAAWMTAEQGKPIAESTAEVLVSADTIDWFAEEGRRAYGRIVPSRAPSVRQSVIREPVGVVAAFTPWNFPLSQAARKVGAALAAGCTIVLKGPEETPASCAALASAFEHAELPAGALNLVWGVPAEISKYLIAAPVVRKVSFTGSVPVGKLIAGLAAAELKRCTLELGGHGPVIVTADSDIEAAARTLVGYKFRNAGQVCVSPTRFLVEKSAKAPFVETFVSLAEKIEVGDGAAKGTVMGPLANDRRLAAMAEFTDDAVANGATLRTGGRRIGNRGYFFAPTVLEDVPHSARIMHEEPFGPILVVNAFDTLDEAIGEANRLPFGLAAFAFSSSPAKIAAMSQRLETGMLSVNHTGLGLPEIPFGGVKESGYGSENGQEGIEPYLVTKLVTEMHG